MNANKKFAATAILAALTFSLFLLGAARPCQAQEAANAPMNGLHPNGDAGVDTDSQAHNLAAIPGAILSSSLDAPRFNQIADAGIGEPYQPSNFVSRLEQFDASSEEALPAPPVANTPTQVTSDLPAENTSPENTGAVPAAPKPSESSEQGFHFSVSPYLFFAGMHGTVGALGQEASVHASFGQIFSYLNFGVMVAMEARYNRIVMPLDFFWMKLSDDKGLPIGSGASSVKVKLNEDMLAPKIGYRIIDTEKFKVDALAGFRYWHIGSTLTLETPLGSTGFYQAADWVDGLGGAKIQAMLSPKVVLTIAGDAGGGGANLDYQVAGLIGWKLKKVILQGGYRYMVVNYRPGGNANFIYDVTMSGIVLGVTIPLK